MDLSENKLVNKIFAGSDPEQFALSHDGKTLYASNEDASALSIVDAASGKLVATLPMGQEPEGVALSPDGKLLASAGGDSTWSFGTRGSKPGEVRVWDAVSGG